MDLLDIVIAKQLAGGGGGSGTDNYNDLSNLPKINDVTLSGNKSSSTLGLQSEITSENKLDSDLIDDTDQDNKFVTSAEKNTWNGKQNAIDADHKLNADYVDDSTSTNKFVTATDKETWNAKQNAIDNSHKLSSDLVDDANHTNKFVTSTEKNTWNGKQNAIDSEHKLSSSLVSFTTAEAAALASGIDSAKVAQISTNQSNILSLQNDVTALNSDFVVAENNILYNLNMGVKNIINIYGAPTSAQRGITYTNMGDGSYKVNGTVTTTPSYLDMIYDIPLSTLHLSIGDQLVITTNSNTVGLMVTARYTDGTTGYNSVGTAASPYVYTIPDNTVALIIRLCVEGVGTKVNNVIVKPMFCKLDAWNQSHDYIPPALPNYDLTRMVSELQKKAVKVYTYHVNPNESDPEDAVTYLDDATGLTPAKMGASSFSYGSWANAWFLPRPCVLKFDGTVDYYLNPNDYSKKTDGTASTIDSSNSTGNVMLEFPKIWVKRVNDGNGARTVSIAPVNVDGTYKCWSNINAEDKEVDHFYLPAYNGTIHSSKMRSLSGVTLNATYAPNYTRAQEVTAATANNPTGKNMWYTETWADMCLIYDLLYLMGKSLDVQRTFGQGLSSGSETAMRAYVTGTHNAKGLFYGDISGTSTAVKVLGMENLWGCRWHGVAGLINDNGTLKVKMTYGVADGSTAVGYNTTGSGYLNYGSTYGTNGLVKKMQADNTMGYKIIETAGTDATYYCDYYYVNNSVSAYALLGGSSGDGANCGFSVNLLGGAASASWAIGGSLSCRP